MYFRSANDHNRMSVLRQYSAHFFPNSARSACDQYLRHVSFKNDVLLNKLPQHFNLSIDSLELDKNQLEGVWNQLDKDVSLCGLTGFSNVRKSGLNEFLADFNGFLTKIQKNNQDWMNLIYRIDLPSNVDILSLSTKEIASLFTLRAFQKVWLRQQFSSGNDIQRDSSFLTS